MITESKIERLYSKRLLTIVPILNEEWRMMGARRDVAYTDFNHIPL